MPFERSGVQEPQTTTCRHKPRTLHHRSPEEERGVERGSDRQLTCRRHLSDRQQLPHQYAQTRHSILLTAKFIVNFEVILFQRSLNHRRSQADRVRVREKNVPNTRTLGNFCRTLRQSAEHFSSWQCIISGCSPPLKVAVRLKHVVHC